MPSTVATFLGMGGSPADERPIGPQATVARKSTPTWRLVDGIYSRFARIFVVIMWRDCPKGADLSSVLARRIPSAAQLPGDAMPAANGRSRGSRLEAALRGRGRRLKPAPIPTRPT